VVDRPTKTKHTHRIKGKFMTPVQTAAKYLVKFSILGALGFTTAACSSLKTPFNTPSSQYFSSQELPDLALPAAPLPKPFVGDKYYFSNGWSEQVTGTDAKTIDILTKRNRKATNYRNFILPEKYVEGTKADYFKQSRIPQDVLWPLVVGNSTSFTTEALTVSKTTGREDQYAQKWTCAVEGAERVRVLAGEFDTFRVKCDRRSASNKWWQSYTWYYAPLINTYVLRRRNHKTNGESVRELTAVRPSLTSLPRRQRNAIVSTWQDALENAPRGESRSWNDPATATATRVEPQLTYKAKNGQFCRTYTQSLTRQGDTRTYAGVACRTGKLKWRTPTRG